MMKALEYVDRFLEGYEDYKKYWNYEDGCVLVGCIDLYAVTGEKKYRDFVVDYCDRFVGPFGSIVNFDYRQYSTDSINASKALFFALDETGDGRYRAAIEQSMERVRNCPRCKCGNFFHKERYAWQVWLDGLYMLQPFYAAYEMRFGGKAQIGDIVNQFKNVRKNLYIEETGLYVHGWDESRAQFWCDKETGRSANYWLRSMGWYLMALIDCIDLIDEQLYEHRRALIDLFREAVAGILPYADEKSGMFFQVIDRKDLEGNYTETSGTAMVAYAVLKGVRLGVLSEEKAKPFGIRAFEGLLREKLTEKADGSLSLKDICLVAGLGKGPDGGMPRDGSAEYYLSEPKCEDDSKGTGPFMMALSEYLRAGKE